MSIELIDIIKQWLLTWNSSEFTILEPGPDSTIPIDFQGAIYYRKAPVYWSGDIFEDRILYFHHGECDLIWATDPECFTKLKKALDHVVAALDCNICRSEIATNFTNDD